MFLVNVPNCIWKLEIRSSTKVMFPFYNFLVHGVWKSQFELDMISRANASEPSIVTSQSIERSLCRKRKKRLLAYLVLQRDYVQR